MRNPQTRPTVRDSDDQAAAHSSRRYGTHRSGMDVPRVRCDGAFPRLASCRVGEARVVEPEKHATKPPSHKRPTFVILAQRAHCGRK